MLNQRKIDDAFVTQATSNMGYIYKDQAKQFIIEFLNKYSEFRPFDAVRENNGVIMTFIELRGFVEISKIYHQMVIGISKNFPQGPPIFLISINKSLFTINKEQELLQNQSIFLEKDQTGADFIRFNFSFLSIGWKPMTSLVGVFDQLMNLISNPPLLTDLSNSRHGSNDSNRQMGISLTILNIKKDNETNQKNSAKNSILLTQLVDTKSIQISNDLSTLQQLQQQKQKLQYIKSRNQYLLNQHLNSIKTILTSKNNQLQKQAKFVSSLKQKIDEQFVFDQCLSINQKDEQKLQKMAEREALKEAESKVKQTLQGQLEIGKKYSDYKKVVRTLFSQMYQNQSKILQIAL